MAKAIVPTSETKTTTKNIQENNWFEGSEIGYMALAFIMASMPHSKPKETYFVRRNGNFALKLQADQEVGLPYGSIPRLILAWITTEAVRTKSRTLDLGKNLSEFLDKVGVTRSGKSIKALKDQMKRLFSTSISFVYETEEQSTRLNMFPVTKSTLWWAPKNADKEELELENSTIVLDENFFDEITNNPVPVYVDALKILRKSPLALDVYLWLTYKKSWTKQPVMISWESLRNQFGAEYPRTAQGKSDFKRKFKEALKKVEAVYPEAGKLQVGDDGLLVLPGKPHVPKLEGKETAV